MTKKNFLIISVTLVSLVATIFFGYIFFEKTALADEINSNSDDIFQDVKLVDLNGDGANEKAVVTTQKIDDRYQTTLEISTTIFKSQTLTLLGFESEVKFCSPALEKITDQSAFLCLFGDVGVHSRNIQLITLKDNLLVPIYFKKGSTETKNIFTDAPNFGFIRNQQGYVDAIFADYRDYDKDPTVDIIRCYYYFENNAFSFTKYKEARFDLKIN